MNLKDFNAKQFFLEKGERIGLGIALFLMIVLIITSLFIPPNGLFSGSPVEKAEDLKKETSQVQQQLTTRRPTPGDTDQPGDPSDKLIALETRPVSLEPYRVISFFDARQGGTSSRRPPELLTIDGAAAQPYRANVKTYQLIPNEDGQYTKIIVLETGGGGKGGFGMLRSMPTAPGMSGPGGRRPGGGGPGAMGPGGGSFASLQRGMISPGANVQASEDMERKEHKPKVVSVDRLDDLQGGFEPAVQPRPLRMAIIAASFPYRRQLEEFRNKLHLESITDVLNETVKTKDGEDDAFRFTGVNVQRREVDGAGNVLTAWQTIDPARAYVPWLMLSGQEIEDEDPRLLRIKFRGLVMDHLRLFRPDDLGAPQQGNQPFAPGMPAGAGVGAREPAPTNKDIHYPEIFEQVPNLKKTLQALKEEGAAERQIAAPRSRFAQPKTIDPWGGGAARSDDRSKTPAPMPTKETGKQEELVPEHCLVRVIDITIEPGKTYQYRLQVRMRNPNYHRKDVASQAYAEAEELPVDDTKWFEVPEKVSVPPEMIHYVVDQKEVERHYRGPNWNQTVHPDREVALQIHRWVEATYLGKQVELTFIGDWAIADRVIVARGEQIGRRVKVELPVWKYTYKDYIIPSDPRDRSRKPGIDINFGYERPDGAEAILVDFEGGKGQSYTPPPPKSEDGSAPPTSKGTTDESGIEALILTPDGKLIARNSANDRDDKARIDRREELHKRVEEVKKKGGGKESGRDPFGNTR